MRIYSTIHDLSRVTREVLLHLNNTAQRERLCVITFLQDFNIQT